MYTNKKLQGITDIAPFQETLVLTNQRGFGTKILAYILLYTTGI